MALEGARRAFMGCITAFFFGLCFRVLLPLPPARLAAADFSGSIVTLRSGSSGRYIEVGDDLWLYASSHTNNKPSVRFEVVPVPDELARALAHTREYEEPGAGVEAKGTWDLRTAAVKEATPAETAVGQAPDDPWAGGAEWDLDRAADDDLWDGGGFDGDGGFRRRLLWGVPVGVRDGAPAAELDAERRTVLPGGRWVALRSAYGGGFVEVLPRSQADEYVARVARDGQLSFRSLLLLRRDAVWSHAVGGYINLRGAQEGDAREHLRAHGNDAPFRPLRDLAASARFHVERRAPVVDVIGAMRCPEAPTFDWNLLLDAARAGACDAWEGAEADEPPHRSLRLAAAALRALEEALGGALGLEAADLASAYRSVLLNPEWSATVDLQLAPCAQAEPARPFSRVDGDRLVVDRRQCPRAVYAEAWLPADASGDFRHAMVPVGGEEGADEASVELKTDAVFALCEPPPPSLDTGGDLEFGQLAGGWPSWEESGSRWPGLDGDLGIGTAPGDEEDPGPLAREDEDEEDFEGLDEGEAMHPVRRLLMGDDAPTEEAILAAAVENATSAAEPTAQRHNLHFRLSSHFVAEEGEGAAEEEGEERAPSEALSVLMLMIDATSRAHLGRMCARSLGALRAMAAAGSVRLYEFSQFSTVGYNSIPNMVPMYTGLSHDELQRAPRGDAGGWEPVWAAFKRRGYATFLGEEIHDGCGDLSAQTPSSACKLFYALLGAAAMPHHNVWQAFCQPELPQCCTDPLSFLRPGRRQCVNGADLHALLLGYVRDFARTYASQPRFGLMNLMTAHEHFMHRLSALDDDLSAFLGEIEAALRADTALFLLSDHGTHGIWYNHFAVGQLEHRDPALLLVLPSGFVDRHPGVDAALRRNTARRVTAYDIHATLRHLASWPLMPQPTLEATSLFVDLEDDRPCDAARVPAEWCVERPPACGT